MTSMGGSATFCQSGGELDAGSIDVISSGGVAVFRLLAGQATTSSLRLGLGAMPLTTTTMPVPLPCATLSLGGPKANLTIGSVLSFEAGSSFDAQWSTQILFLGGSLANMSTSSASLDGLGQSQLVFVSGPQMNPGINWQTVEVAGKDLGLVREGFLNNFVVDCLQIGSANGAALCGWWILSPIRAMPLSARPCMSADWWLVQTAGLT